MMTPINSPFVRLHSVPLSPFPGVLFFGQTTNCIIMVPSFWTETGKPRQNAPREMTPGMAQGGVATTYIARFQAATPFVDVL